MDLLKYSIMFFLIAGLAVTGCVTTQEDGEPVTEEESPETRIARLIQLMQISKEQAYYRLCQEIIGYEEVALPLLAENSSNFHPMVRLGCIYCIGQIYKNTKSSESLALTSTIADRLKDPVNRVKMEAAATLCEMGDYRGVPILIDCLKNKHTYVRWVASQTLFTTFNLTFNYSPTADPQIIEESARKWENWWVAHKEKYIKKAF